MAKKYKPQLFEKKWQGQWKKSRLYYPVKDTVRGKKNKLILTEFPYPSGNLHIGHWYAFSLPDSLARYERMRGKNVLYPIGFDAFGLPAENAAIKRKLNPKKWTEKNIQFMSKQFESMGATFDWSRVVSTIDPKYYQWTQWMFLQMFERGLAYRAETTVNWCPKDKTVLANEQVVGGLCERCDTEVEQQKKEQWMFRITAYAEKLLDGLEKVEWPHTIVSAQKNWIGKSEGARVRFALNVPGQGEKHSVEVFTTRPDTLFGATFLVISPELAESWLKVGWIASAEVTEYVKKSLGKRELERVADTKDKTGVYAGIEAVHPLTKQVIPVWIAEYVLGSYGTGAVMAVPAHDERDNAFAKKFNLPIQHVVVPTVVDHTNPPQVGRATRIRRTVHALVYSKERNAYLTLKNHKFNWDTVIIGGVEDTDTDLIEAAKREVAEETGYVDLEFKRILGGPVQASYFATHKNENRVAITTAVYFELQSEKQIDISAEEKDSIDIVWRSPKDFVPEKMVNSELPFWLERLKSETDIYEGSGILINSENFSGMGSVEAKNKILPSIGSKPEVTYRLRDWVISRQRFWGVPIPMIKCKDCGYVPVKDKDLPVLLPTLKDYLPTDDGRSPLAKAKSWVKVRCPHCKEWAERETDTMDTFVDSSWYYLRYTDPKNKKQFASKKNMRHWLPAPLYLGGSDHNTMHLLYSRFIAKVLKDLGGIEFDEPFIERVNRGWVLGPNGQKMSKSKGNVIDPDVEVKRYGADTVRMYLGFMAPYDQGGSWDPRGIVGVHRFLSRVYVMGMTLAEVSVKKSPKTVVIPKELDEALHKALKKVGEDLPELKFNTAISALMVCMNTLDNFIQEDAQASRVVFSTFLKMLAPLAPHLAEELWHAFGNKKSIHLESWPVYDPKKAIGEVVRIAVSINGKTRDLLIIDRDHTDESIEEMAKALPGVAKWLEGEVKIQRVIHVKDRLINFVLS